MLRVKTYLVLVNSTLIAQIYLYLHGAKFKKVSCWGIPYIYVSLTGIFKIGDNFKMNNGILCQSGYNGKCRIEVHKNAKLIIGNNVGISATTITCFEEIIIEDNIRIGVGTHIYDTDFHSLDPNLRTNPDSDHLNKISKPIKLEKNVFIGANVHILKGVTIGMNSVVGAGSVVTKNIPSNEIWGGNPAKFIRNL